MPPFDGPPDLYPSPQERVLSILEGFRRRQRGQQTARLEGAGLGGATVGGAGGGVLGGAGGYGLARGLGAGGRGKLLGGLIGALTGAGLGGTAGAPLGRLAVANLDAREGREFGPR